VTALSRITRWRFGLDPDRSARRFGHYDGRGFERWHDLCRAACRAPVDPDHPVRRVLAQQGVCLLDVMSPAAASALRARLHQLPVLPPRIRDVEWAEDFDISDRDFSVATLDTLLTPTIAEAIRSQLESEFLVYWWNATRTLQGKPSTRSMLWHCDTGPTRHLKLLVYLEDAAFTGGNTHFFDRSISDGLRNAGYTFGRTRRRRADLAPLMRHLGMPERIIDFPLRAGQALLFEPTRTLHRGIVPHLHHRHVVTLCLLPSPLPWREVMLKAGLPGQHNMLWPDDVAALEQRLAPLLDRSQAGSPTDAAARLSH
jgi:hypothetical protein